MVGPAAGWPIREPTGPALLAHVGQAWAGVKLRSLHGDREVLERSGELFRVFQVVATGYHNGVQVPPRHHLGRAVKLGGHRINGQYIKSRKFK